jgi:hypothetical protein
MLGIDSRIGLDGGGHFRHSHWLRVRTRRNRGQIAATAEAEARDRSSERDGSDDDGGAEHRVGHTLSAVASVGPLTDSDDSTQPCRFEFRGEF